MKRGIAVAALVVVCGFAGASQAAKVYRWVDRDGKTHYGDRVPENVDAARTQVERIPVPATSEPIARLILEQVTLEQGDGHLRAWAENSLAGPIEVRLYESNTSRSAALRADPPLPAHAVVPGLQRAMVATVAGDRSASLRMDVVPGDPNAKPRDVEYLYPLQIGSVQIEQGYGGAYSHDDAQNRHAVDFAADIGTPVLAARAGTVMQVEADFDRGGLNAEKYTGRANFVRIVHDDGTMALYAHLKLDGVLARVGQRVRKGQTIGLSGNTGYTTGPHLHFVVQVNRGMQLESIPFRMFGPGGILRFTEPQSSQTP